MGLIEKLQEVKENFPIKPMVFKLVQTFSENTEIEELDLRYLDTSKCNQISSLFTGCTNLKRVNMSTWDTSNIQQILNFFTTCSSLEEVDLSNFNTKRFTTFRSWFYNCSSIKEIALDITNATNLQYTFKNCTSLEKIDFTGTEDVKTNLDLSTTGLTTQGLMDMLNTLPQLEEGCYTTIIIGEEKLSLLTEEQVAIFYEKGYTLM